MRRGGMNEMYKCTCTVRNCVRYKNLIIIITVLTRTLWYTTISKSKVDRCSA